MDRRGGNPLNHNHSWKLTFQIFWSFLKIAPITFGGGYAIIPVI